MYGVTQSQHTISLPSPNLWWPLREMWVMACINVKPKQTSQVSLYEQKLAYITHL